MSVSSYEELSEYKGRIKNLCLSTEKCVGALTKIYDEPVFNNFEGLKNLLGRINQDNFKVVVIGKFSTGKSTLINALLGEDVLPDSLDPCTAFINEIIYGAKPRATIYFKENIPANWQAFVQDESIAAHINKFASNIPPYVIENLEDLSNCVTIPVDEDGVAIEFEGTDCSPFEKAVIEYPCELCKNGVEIIDSPGLDESQDRTEIVEKYFKKVDAVIYVMTNIATGGEGDKEIVEKYLTSNDIKNIFFVCNLFGVKIEKAKKQLLNRLKKIFAGRTLLCERGFHLVNLFDFVNTGVEPFKGALAAYLNNEKGRAQLTSYNEKLTELSNIVKDGIANFERISTRELRAIDADILSVENDIAAKEKFLAKAKTSIYNMQLEIDAFCKVDILEKFKKHNHTTRTYFKEKDLGTRSLSNSADEAATTRLSAELAKEYAVIVEQKMDEYVREELLCSIIEEISSELKNLQEETTSFGACLELPVFGNSCEFNDEAVQEASKVFEKNLELDLSKFISYDAMNLQALLEPAVSTVFTMYGDYKKDARGSKLTEEILAKLSIDVQERMARDKRIIANYIIREVLKTFSKVMFDVSTNAMEDVLAKRRDTLDSYRQTRNNILAKREEETLKCEAIIKKLNDNLQTLAVLQEKIDA
ncbi:MAG: dynamin family protein [Phascolarctobacterium sp.]|nr:dynamin family protein [Phascolarctobacterium sp.]